MFLRKNQCLKIPATDSTVSQTLKMFKTIDLTYELKVSSSIRTYIYTLFLISLGIKSSGTFVITCNLILKTLSCASCTSLSSSTFKLDPLVYALSLSLNILTCMDIYFLLALSLLSLSLVLAISALAFAIFSTNMEGTSS